MAYQVLARKWRPQDFDAVVGQEPVVTALRNALSEERIAAAYLFSGIRGVGKTSVARILARALNCERGMAGAPCNECATCREFDSGANLDILEIDAATHSKVEQVRELTENLKYKPVSGRYKVVVLDEVHRLSRQAFDALLKIVEEPPPHLVFIFATTELESVPATILSRCQEFNFQRVPQAELTAHLRRLAEAESIEVSDKALLLIARAGEGSVRDSVALLDQLATYGSGAIDDDDAVRVLGGVDPALHHQLLAAIVAGDRSVIVALVNDLETRGRDPKHVYGEFLAYCRDALHLALGGGLDSVELSDDDAAALRSLATDAGYETLLRLLQLLLAGEESVRRSESASLAVEIAWLRGAELPKLTAIETLLGTPPTGGGERTERNEPGESSSKSSATGAASAAARSAAAPEPPTPRSSPKASTAPPPLADEADGEPPVSGTAPEPVGAVPPPPAPAAAIGSTVDEPAAAPSAEIRGDGVERFLELIRVRRQVIAAHLEEVQSLVFEAGELVLTAARGDSWLATALRRKPNLSAFEDCLKEAFGDGARWRLIDAVAAPPVAPEPTAANGDSSGDGDVPADAGRPAAVEHPTVQAALDVFGGTAEPIEPTNGQETTS